MYTALPCAYASVRVFLSLYVYVCMHTCIHACMHVGVHATLLQTETDDVWRDYKPIHAWRVTCHAWRVMLDMRDRVIMRDKRVDRSNWITTGCCSSDLSLLNELENRSSKAVTDGESSVISLKSFERNHILLTIIFSCVQKIAFYSFFWMKKSLE